MHSLSIFGTSSDAGKSTLSFAITYLLHKQGIKVAPFKAQNVSNNSVVTDIDTGEIAIPQAFAAEVIGLKTTPLFNPILLKSGAKNKAHLIINGKNVKDTDVHTYYKNISKLQPVVKKAFEELLHEYECIVAEGAGSPVELNLMDKDLSNIYVAKEFKTKIVLVADIERGGVFASIYGVYNLLPKELRKNLIGVIVNKFRGDRSLFDEGVKIIEKDFGIKVLGVVPYLPFNLGFEDAASLMNYQQNTHDAIIKIAVIKLPHISNFTDFEPLVADREIALDFINTINKAKNYDLLILPGSKRVFDDLHWLREQGFEQVLQNKEQRVVAVCGGYEMMFENLIDENGVESDIKMMQGFGRIKGDVTFQANKVLTKGCYNLFGTMCNGYEIHNGTTKKRAKKAKNFYGTFVHGLFESDALRQKIFRKIDPDYRGYDFQAYKAKAINDFAKHIEKHIDLHYIQEKLDDTQ
ncbi:cobyric acid synthase [Sulfurimonas paralvinellae]|uniref:Cobyric acid synthase n=1 Tax=Sulfurimonas paralvinellae TaxID=317658 RepID=A0A7M1B7Z0_9BACT|nr:cobyric acid synthase [Sulfurimonas paralvinellae]QOP44842.1 cobyric acid synthase [Sulfurimonas paralvinellae]